MTRVLSLVFCLFVCVQFSSAKAPIKFGRIDIEDLKMTVYEPDTSANAVVLCKYGYFNGNDYKFTIITRVKILKKSGTSLSEFSFPGKEDMQVRAKVYNLENDEIVAEKVKGDCIYKLKVSGNYYKMQVALPNVKVGSVYDIETSRFLLPSDFAFQREIPIKHCELVLEETTAIDFRKRMRGFEQINSVSSNKFVVDNMPAFKTEGYMDSKDNYITKFEFDILSISVAGYYESFTTSWEAVNDKLLESTYFGEVMRNGAGFLSDIKKEIEEKYTDPEAKLEAAYKAIQEVKWNERSRLYASENHLGRVFKNKKANSAEINMLLLMLLKKLDIESDPVAMSTRRNGQLDRFYPSLQKLNYMVVHVTIGDKEYVLDATSDLLPMGMLPERTLNKCGRLVNKESGKWIDLQTELKDKEVFMYNLTLSEELDAVGTLECQQYDYAAYHFRDDYRDYTSDDEYLEDFESDCPGLRVKSFELSDVDSIKKPVKEVYDIKISNFAQQLGDMITINPFAYEQITDNPFKLEKRNYPVDFTYKREDLVISTINIPEGYSFTTIPKPARIRLPENGGSVLINYSTNGNTLNVMYRLKIDKVLFLPSEYDYLKQLFALIIEKQAEPVIIKKTQDAASL